MNEVLKRRIRSLQRLSVVQQDQGEEKDCGYFVVSPSKRYFKRVFNKDLQPEKKGQSREIQHFQPHPEKTFVRSPQNINHRNHNQYQEPLSQQSLHNFSMGLFHNPQTDNKGMLDESSLEERKSVERKLDFSKIFIVQQNTPHKQIIQLSERQKQNRNMLEKAVQQLQRRKLQKKFKMLKKQMKIQVSKYKQLDQSIEDLRSHKIGYKTFYRKQVLDEKANRIEEIKLKINENQNYSKQSEKRKELLTQLAVQKFLNQDNNKSQQSNILLINDWVQTRKRNKTKVESTPTLIRNDSNSFPRQKRQILDQRSYKTTNKSQVPLLLSKELIQQRDFKKRQQTQMSKKKSSSSLLSGKFQTPQGKSLKYNLKSVQYLPNIIKSSQNLSRNNSNSQSFLRQSSNLQNFTSTKHKNQSTQQKFQPRRTTHIDDQFTYLLSRQQLQSTLNKSRYEIKKLLCLHIQNRKREWRRNKSKSLLDQKFILETCKEISQSAKKFNTELATIEETPKEMESSLYLEKKRSVSAGVVPAPTHLMKLHTKELKKSIKSFVRKMKGSPRKNTNVGQGI